MVSQFSNDICLLHDCCSIHHHHHHHIICVFCVRHHHHQAIIVIIHVEKRHVMKKRREKVRSHTHMSCIEKKTTTFVVWKNSTLKTHNIRNIVLSLQEWRNGQLQILLLSLQMSLLGIPLQIAVPSNGHRCTDHNDQSAQAVELVGHVSLDTSRVETALWWQVLQHLTRGTDRRAHVGDSLCTGDTGSRWEGHPLHHGSSSQHRVLFVCRVLLIDGLIDDWWRWFLFLLFFPVRRGTVFVRLVI